MTRLLLALAVTAAALLPAHAQKISDLPGASALSGVVAVPVVQDGATKQATLTQFQTFVLSSGNPTFSTLSTVGDITVGGDVNVSSSIDMGPGVVLNWNHTDVTITHSDNALAFAGAENGYSFDSGLLLPESGAISWDEDVTLTHSAGVLTLAGGSLVAPTVLTDSLQTPASAELTIASGEIAVTGSYHTVDTESDGATDDLDTINDGVDGQRLVLRPAADDRTVVVKNSTGNIEAGADCTLDNAFDTWEGIYDATLTAWLELGCNDNGA